MRKKYKNKGMTVRGFARVQLLDKAKRIIGDSGYFENTLVDTGRNECLAGAVVAQAASFQVSYMGIGTGTTAVNVTQTDLQNYNNSRVTCSPTTVATGTARCTASFDGSANSATLTIGEIALFGSNVAGSLVASQTFTTSQMTTDQTLNATYELRFA